MIILLRLSGLVILLSALAQVIIFLQPHAYNPPIMWFFAAVNIVCGLVMTVRPYPRDNPTSLKIPLIP